jgi:hypothetical protein
MVLTRIPYFLPASNAMTCSKPEDQYFIFFTSMCTVSTYSNGPWSDYGNGRLQAQDLAGENEVNHM